MFTVDVKQQYNNIISLYYNITSSCHETEFETMLFAYFSRCQTEGEISVKENLLQTFCFQELQDVGWLVVLGLTAL